MKLSFRVSVYGCLLTGVGCLVLFSFSDAFAAAAVQRRVQMQKQMQAQYQQQMQAQYQQQMVAQYQQQQAAQQQAAYQQAYQQAAYQQAAQQYAQYKAQMEAAVAQRNAQIQIAQQQAQQYAAVQQVSAVAQYSQAAQAKAMAEAQTQAQVNGEVQQYAAFLARRKALLEAQAVQAKEVQTAKDLFEYNAYQKARAMKTQAALSAKIQHDQAKSAIGAKLAQDVMSSKSGASPDGGKPNEPETSVGIHELWSALDVSAKPWEKIIDNEIKILTVGEYMDRFARAGITIKKAPGFYAKFIDTLVPQMPGMLEAPFMNVLSYAAIIEYDFGNGKNKDELARQVLGSAEAFNANKARLEKQ
ncbi:MAG: hypothetical protein HQL16_07955 [Candidatus Omnitrophica bacterium]|nr:hypothetical protein [Candidatus Omnitrophota bacterium]